MASSVAQNEVDDLSEKIDTALEVWDNRKVDASTDKSESNIISFQAMYDAYRSKMSEKSCPHVTVEDLVFFDVIISFDIAQPGFLTREKSVEAVIFSKTYAESEFEKSRHQHEGELLWVRKPQDLLYLVHVPRNEIICTITECALTTVRMIAKLTWSVLKERARKNLFDSLSTSEHISEWSKYASNLHSSFDVTASNNSTSDGHHIRYPLTADVKKVLLDEVSSLNLDPRLKQQFVFDLKLLPDKDMLYWRDQVDRLRFISSCVAAITPEQAVADHETSAQVTEPKSDEKLLQLVENISNMQETVNHNVLSLAKLLEENVNDGSSAAIREDLRHMSQIMIGVESGLEYMRLHQQECNSGVEESSKCLEALSAISKIEKSCLSTVDHVKKLDGTVNPIRLTVDKLAIRLNETTTLLKRLAEKMNVSTKFSSLDSLEVLKPNTRVHQGQNFSSQDWYQYHNIPSTN